MIGFICAIMRLSGIVGADAKVATEVQVVDTNATMSTYLCCAI